MKLALLFILGSLLATAAMAEDVCESQLTAGRVFCPDGSTAGVLQCIWNGEVVGYTDFCKGSPSCDTLCSIRRDGPTGQ
jgi:hypothetical protein